MMRGGWLLSIYRENFVDNIRRSLKKRKKKKKKVKGTKRLELVLSVGLDSAQKALYVLLCVFVWLSCTVHETYKYGLHQIFL